MLVNGYPVLTVIKYTIPNYYVTDLFFHQYVAENIQNVVITLQLNLNAYVRRSSLQ